MFLTEWLIFCYGNRIQAEYGGNTSLYNLNTESDTLIPSLKAIIYNGCNKKVIIRKEF